MRRFALLSLPITLLLILAPVPAAAQTASRFSVQASALYVGVSGDAFEGVESGGGFEAQVRYTPSVFSIGIGYQSSFHQLDFEGVQEDVDFSGVFIEPRYVIDIGRRTAAPYVSARVAYLRQSASVEDVTGTTYDLTSDGTQINLGGGVLVRLSRVVNLDVGLTLGRINFGTVEVSAPGVPAQEIDTGSAGDGTNAVVRVGVAIGVGR